MSFIVSRIQVKNKLIREVRENEGQTRINEELNDH